MTSLYSGESGKPIEAERFPGSFGERTHQFRRGGVSYAAQGRGAPVVLVHGVGASFFDWASLMPTLAEHGFSTYAPDLLGHGESEKPQTPDAYTLQSVFAHFSRWLDELQLDRPIRLVGHSLGGYLSLWLALQRPQQVESLVLINPLYSLKQLSPWLKWVTRRPELGEHAMRITPTWLLHAALGWDPDSGRNFDPQVRRQIVLDYKRASPHFVYITRDVPDLSPHLSQVSSKTLLLWGERDLTLNPASFPRLQQALPRVQSSSFPGCGHQPHIGRPKLVNRQVLEFLQQESP